MPTSGQVSEKRSPPLSLVKTTSVLSAAPVAASAARMRPMPSSMWRTIVRYVWTEPPSVWEILLQRRGPAASSSRVSQGQCGAV